MSGRFHVSCVALVLALGLATTNAGAEDRSHSLLAHNRWRVVLIGKRAVTVEAQRQEPWIHFAPETGLVTGSGGCNRISGSYKERGRKLRVGNLISTRMACPAMEDESAFLRALRETRRYRLKGRILDLLDERGKRLVRLEEANL